MQYNIILQNVNFIRRALFVSAEIMIYNIEYCNSENTNNKKDYNKNLQSMRERKYRHFPTMSFNVLKDTFLPNRWTSWTYQHAKEGYIPMDISEQSFLDYLLISETLFYFIEQLTPGLILPYYIYTRYDNVIFIFMT